MMPSWAGIYRTLRIIRKNTFLLYVDKTHSIVELCVAIEKLGESLQKLDSFGKRSKIHRFPQGCINNSESFKLQNPQRNDGASPTSPFTILELQNPSHGVRERHKIRRSPDLEALKLRKGSLGWSHISSFVIANISTLF